MDSISTSPQAPQNLTEEELLVHIDECHEAIRRLQDEIQKQQHTIRDHNSRLNNVRPLINSLLPSELLAEIFMQYMLLCTPPGYHESIPVSAKSQKTPPYQWLMVAHVCRYWRSIALSYSTLFTYVLLRSSKGLMRDEMVMEWLTHSRNAPIHIVGELDEHSSLWEHIIPHLSHAVSLDISLPPASRTDINVSWPVCPLMRTMSCALPVDEETLQPVPNVFDKFLDRLPNLEKLVINTDRSNGIDWTHSPIPSSLRELKIVSWAFSETDHLKSLLSILHRLPNVSTLEMEKLLLSPPKEPSGEPEIDNNIPSVSTLKLSGHITPVTAIAKSIMCSRGIQISISTVLRNDTGLELFRTLFETLVSHHQVHFLALRLAELTISLVNNHMAYLVNFKGYPLHATDKGSPSVNITVYCNDSGLTHELFEALCDATYPFFDSLESLSVSLCPDSFGQRDRTLITSCCRQLRGLCSLRISAARPLLYAFMTLLGSRHGDLMFPDLASLQFICHDRQGYSVDHILRIRDVLMRRGRRNAELLSCLTLKSIRKEDKWLVREIEEEIEILREMVGTLTILGPA